MSKKWTRRSALGLIGSGAGLLTWGTGGFTEVQGNRNVSLDTQPDPNGLVGFDDDDGSVSGCTGERIDLFELTNNFGDSMSVDDVTITSASGDLDTGDINNIGHPSSIGSGLIGTVTGDIPGNANVGSGQISFEIDVTQNDVSTTLDRTVGLTVKTEVIKAFTTVGSQTWNVPSGVANVDALVVGGGGGGAAHTGYNSAGGGGGGAGGVVFATDYAVPEGGSVNLTVGDGGAGKDQSAPVTGENGYPSTFDQLDAKGGGGGNLTGGNGNQSANDGGSGGGGRENPPGAATQPGTNAIVNRAVDFGNDGARNSTDNGGGGGGGAGENPADISGSDGGAGGDGVAEAIINGETYVFADIFGTQYGESNGGDVYFAGGGGGGGDGTGGSGNGGLGGGGNGASDRDNEVAEDGIQNTGAGGGGGASGPSGEPGGDGGSGVVLLNYCTSNPPTSTPSAEVQVDSTSSLDGGQANSFTHSHTMNSGSNQAVYVFLQLMDTSSSKDAASVTYAGDSLTEIKNFDGGDIRVQVFRKLVPASGTNDVVVDLDVSSQNKVGIGVIGFDNVNQSNPEGAISTNSGQGSDATITGISTETGDLVVDAIGTDKSVGSPGSGQTERWAAEAESGKQAKGSTKDDSGSVDMSWSFGGGKFTHVAFNINSV
jgi:hypothetical protein